MPEYPKQKRIVDRNLVDLIFAEQKYCLVGLDGKYGDCYGEHSPHHIKTRGSGGGDVRGNIIRLCWRHHVMAQSALINKKYLLDLL